MIKYTCEYFILKVPLSLKESKGEYVKVLKEVQLHTKEMREKSKETSKGLNILLLLNIIARSPMMEINIETFKTNSF